MRRCNSCINLWFDSTHWDTRESQYSEQTTVKGDLQNVSPISHDYIGSDQALTLFVKRQLKSCTCTTYLFPFRLVNINHNKVFENYIKLHFAFTYLLLYTSAIKKIGVCNLLSKATSILRLLLSPSHCKRLWKARTCQLHTHNYYYMYLTHLIDPNYSLCSRTNTHNLCPINYKSLNFDAVFLLPLKRPLRSRRFR